MPNLTAEARDTRDFLTRKLANRLVTVPRVDFADVSAGVKTEWRNYGTRPDWLVVRDQVQPIVAFTTAINGDPLSCVVMMERTWVEPIGAISPESLAREGFSGMDEFRRYIIERYPNGGFRPASKCIVYQVRPLTEEDIHEWMTTQWESLYGQFA